jgi:glyceraldehyde 3-phosphate dehydrogenase
MTIRIAINGYGRIGRNILRAHYEKKLHPEIQIVAINDLGDVKTNAYLTSHDTTHGKFPGQVSVEGNQLIINGDKIQVVAERDPRKLPWKELNVDIVFECTGLFTSKEKAGMHLEAGAKKVIISAPATGVDATVVFGVNDDVLKASDTVISNASCTTNCLASVVKPLHAEIGLVSGLMNTVHAFTNDQSLIDVYHSDMRRARSATQSIIPTKTGAASAVGLVLPELNGKLDGFSVRVPTINVSLVDLTFEAKRSTSVAEVNDIIRKAANGAMKGVLAYNEEELVSVDFNHNSASAIFDTFGTKVIGNLVKILAWYDNEWGFSNRMLDVAVVWMQAGVKTTAKAALAS